MTKVLDFEAFAAFAMAPKRQNLPADVSFVHAKAKASAASAASAKSKDALKKKQFKASFFTEQTFFY